MVIVNRSNIQVASTSRAAAVISDKGQLKLGTHFMQEKSANQCLNSSMQQSIMLDNVDTLHNYLW